MNVTLKDTASEKAPREMASHSTVLARMLDELERADPATRRRERPKPQARARREPRPFAYD